MKIYSYINMSSLLQEHSSATQGRRKIGEKNCEENL